MRFEVARCDESDLILFRIDLQYPGDFFHVVDGSVAPIGRNHAEQRARFLLESLSIQRIARADDSTTGLSIPRRLAGY